MNPKSLLERARTSTGGEAYASVAKTAGYRIGLGARTTRGRDARVFVEVILDPFPNRPRVNPERLAGQGELIARLETRGYAITADDDGTIACECAVEPEAATREIRAVLQLVESQGDRARRPRKVIRRR